MLGLSSMQTAAAASLLAAHRHLHAIGGAAVAEPDVGAAVRVCGCGCVIVGVQMDRRCGRGIWWQQAAQCSPASPPLLVAATGQPVLHPHRCPPISRRTNPHPSAPLVAHDDLVDARQQQLLVGGGHAGDCLQLGTDLILACRRLQVNRHLLTAGQVVGQDLDLQPTCRVEKHKGRWEEGRQRRRKGNGHLAMDEGTKTGCVGCCP